MKGCTTAETRFVAEDRPPASLGSSPGLSGKRAAVRVRDQGRGDLSLNVCLGGMWALRMRLPFEGRSGAQVLDGRDRHPAECPSPGEKQEHAPFRSRVVPTHGMPREAKAPALAMGGSALGSVALRLCAAARRVRPPEVRRLPSPHEARTRNFAAAPPRRRDGRPLESPAPGFPKSQAARWRRRKPWRWTAKPRGVTSDKTGGRGGQLRLVSRTRRGLPPGESLTLAAFFS